MIFWLSKTIYYLFLPCTIITVFLLLSLFSKVQKKRKRYLKYVAILFFFFTNPFISDFAFKLLEGEPSTYPKKEYSTAIVLAGMLKIDKSPTDRVYFGAAADRFYQALELYDKGIVKNILITGAHGIVIGDYPSEAQLIKKAYLHAGVKEEDIIIETESRNTYENALYTKKIIEKENLDGPFILITSAFHMRRSAGCFEKQGIKADYYPVHFITSDTKYTLDRIIIPSSYALLNWRILIHESIGLVSYKILGRI